MLVAFMREGVLLRLLLTGLPPGTQQVYRHHSRHRLYCGKSRKNISQIFNRGSRGYTRIGRVYEGTKQSWSTPFAMRFEGGIHDAFADFVFGQLHRSAMFIAILIRVNPRNPRSKFQISLASVNQVIETGASAVLLELANGFGGN